MSKVRRQMKKAANLLERLKFFIRNDGQMIGTEKFIIAQKSCPHCASRGMFIFDSTARSKNSNGQSNENKT